MASSLRLIIILDLDTQKLNTNIIDCCRIIANIWGTGVIDALYFLQDGFLKNNVLTCFHQTK